MWCSLWVLVAAMVLVSVPVGAQVGLDDPASLSFLWREDRRVVDEFVLAGLRDPDAAVRARAALVVGRVGRAGDVGALADCLADAEPGVRRMAVFALGEIADSTAAVPLIAHAASNESDPMVRGALVEALGKLRAGPEACRRALSDPEVSVRARALLAAWQIPVPDIVDEVIERSRGEDRRERWAGAYCLMRLMGAPASGRTPIADAPGLTDDETARAGDRLIELLRETDPEVRLVAARGLRKVGHERATNALRRAATDPDWRVRVEAARSLGDDGRGSRVADFTGLLDDVHPLVAHTAFEQLSTVGSSAEAMPHLLGALRSTDPRRAEIAFRALLTRWQADSARTAEPSRLRQIERLSLYVLGRNAWFLQAAAADAVPLLAADPSAQDVVLAALFARDGRVAKLAVGPRLTVAIERGEGPIGDRVSATIDDATASEDPMVHLMTWTSLAEQVYGDSTSTEADRAQLDTWLTEAYQRWSGPSGVDVRQSVIEALAEVSDRPQAAALLEHALADDDNSLVRRAAAVALDRSHERATGTPAGALPLPSDYTHIARWANSPHWAVFQTTAGRIVAQLFSADAPLTVWNFALLANGGYYDDGAWHRVVPDFVVQDGCPRGDGWGGPDWQIRCEINEHPYFAGALGMALSGKDTGGSQYFFTHSAQPHLDGGYTVFGQLDAANQAVSHSVNQGDAIEWVRVVDTHPETWTR